MGILEFVMQLEMLTVDLISLNIYIREENLFRISAGGMGAGVGGRGAEGQGWG